MSFAEEHTGEVFYCPACRLAFTANEVVLKRTGSGEVYAYCPGVGHGQDHEPCRAEDTDAGIGPTRMSAAEHLEVCEQC